MSNTNPPVHSSAPRHRAPTETSAPARATRRGAVTAGVVAGVVVLPAAAWAIGGGLSARAPEPHAQVAKAPGELVVNGSFEDGLTGWKVNRKASQELARGDQSVSGSWSAKLSTTTGGNVVVNDRAPTLPRTTAGLSYQVTAYVRATGEPVRGKIRVREVSAGAGATLGQQGFQAEADGWSRVSLTYTSETTGSKVDLNVVGRKLAAGDALLVDDLSMVPTTSPGTPSPSSPTPTSSPTTTPTPSPTSSPTSSTPTASPSSSAPTSAPTSTPTKAPSSGCVSDAMGIPSPGQTYLGASSGHGDILDRERQVGSTMRVHRTYYAADRITAAVRIATQDVQAGRLPWISFKAPHSWGQMSSGAGDAWARELADQLATVPGPVWLAVHHEPEKDGDLDLWVGMQRRVAPIIHSRTDNVAYTVIYSSWNTFAKDQNTIATKWPGDQHVDVTAVDAYNPFNVTRNGRTGTKHLDMRSYYVKLAAWAEAHGTAWGIAETGLTRTSAMDDPEWLTRAYEDMVELGGAALSYFDSERNSEADWRLTDDIRQGVFRDLLPGSARIC